MNNTELKNEILKLKAEKNALVLSHLYQTLDVQEISDHVCDSFEMAKLAKNSDKELIVICGVYFMAESAKILSPNKKVLIPVPEAGCPMADMISPEDVKALRSAYPDAAVCCYVNSSAAVKAVSDLCCTSSSALRAVSSLDNKQVIFIPDKNLGSYIAEKLPDKEVILYNGCCPVHNRAKAEDVRSAKAAHPGALFLVHPECPPEVLALADFIGSTAQIIAYASDSGASEFIIGTENEIVARLNRDLPGKTFYPMSASFVCADMKKTSLEDVLNCLKNESFEVSLSAEEIAGASKSLDAMVRL